MHSICQDQVYQSYFFTECEKVGQLVGIKTVINEFVAYKRLSDVKDQLRYGTDGVTNSTISSKHFLGVNHQLFNDCA